MLVFPLPPQERIRSSFLRSEYERSGVPIYEITYREWKKRFYKLTNEDFGNPAEFFGLCYNDIGNLKLDLPRRFIVINRALTNSYKLAVFYHELGHYACAKARCPCSRMDGFIFRQTELHAELTALYLTTQRGFKQMLVNLMVESVRDLNHSRDDRRYNATRIVKHPVFIKARAVVGDMFTKWLNEKKNADLKERYLNAIVDECTRSCRWQPNSFLRRFADATKIVNV